MPLEDAEGRILGKGSARSTPFLDSFSFEGHTPVTATEANPQPAPARVSPFLSVYETAGQAEYRDPEAEALAEFLREIHDSEFDEALLEVIHEAEALVEDRFAAEPGDLRMQTRNVENLLQAHLAPLADEVGRALNTLEEQLAGRDPSAITDEEIEALAEAYVPSQPIRPEFENFLGKLVKKAGSAIVKGAKAAAKVAGGFVLGKFIAAVKKLAPILLRQVVKVAINKLPAQYQPLARKVAEKLGLAKEVAEEQEEEGERLLDATEDVRRIQNEFDQRIAELAFARDDVERELLVAEAAVETRESLSSPLSELDWARERFVRELMELEAGQDPTPIVERFVPVALLPALKLGLKVIGRQKVVNYLARPVAKLIARLIGKEHAGPLSSALVDAGLRLVHLEATPEDEMRAAGEAVAATVEETIRKVASLPEEVLEDEELLEGYVLEAFEEAATVNLPDILSEEVYENRPELREAEHFKSAWVWRPLRGPKRYKKCTRIFDVSVTPHVAQAINTFGGYTLAEFLRDRLGLPAGRPVRARVHLYEAIPGTSLPLLYWHERGIPALGTAGRAGWSQLHPLTPIAAGLLCGAPGLGRDLPPKYWASRRPLFVGERLYALEIPAALPQTVPAPNGKTIVRQPGTLGLTLDFPRNQIRLCIFFSETEAQQIATKIRERARLGLVWTLMRRKVRNRLARAFSTPDRVKVIHGTVAAAAAEPSPLNKLPPIAVHWLKHRVGPALRKGLVALLRERSREFVAAAEQPEDGVTLIVTIENVPGLALLGKALRGETVDLPNLQSLKDVPNATIGVFAGHRRD
jgi:hypothetical protein